MKTTDLTRRVAKRYSFPLSISNFFIALVAEDCVTPEYIYRELGVVEYRGLIYRLRGLMPDLKIHNKRSVGYWLDDPIRIELAQDLGINFSPEVAERMQRIFVLGTKATLVNSLANGDGQVIERVHGEDECESST